MFLGLGALDIVAQHADDAPRPRAGVAATDQYALQVPIQAPADDEHDTHADVLSLARSVKPSGEQLREKATQDKALSMGTETEGMLVADDKADDESMELPADYRAEQPSGSSAEDDGASADRNKEPETALTLGADDTAAEDDVDGVAAAEHEHTANESTEVPGDEDPARLSHVDDAPSGGEARTGSWSPPPLDQNVSRISWLMPSCFCSGGVAR
jgi:hypothetical protein